MYKYCVKLTTTDSDGCDALDVYFVVTAHSFSEALIIAERKLTGKEQILKVNEITRFKRGGTYYGILS